MALVSLSKIHTSYHNCFGPADGTLSRKSGVQVPIEETLTIRGLTPSVSG